MEMYTGDENMDQRDEAVIGEMIEKALHRMHHYTWAEASLQGLQDIWELPVAHSWATAGYMGAIISGQATCGTLIGSALAIGLYCGHNIETTPEDCPDQRNRAIEGVKQLYADFIKTFGDTDCFALCGCDFSNPHDTACYIEKQAWKDKCDVFLRFALKKCLQMSRDRVIWFNHHEPRLLRGF